MSDDSVKNTTRDVSKSKNISENVAKDKVSTNTQRQGNVRPRPTNNTPRNRTQGAGLQRKTETGLQRKTETGLQKKTGASMVAKNPPRQTNSQGANSQVTIPQGANPQGANPNHIAPKRDVTKQPQRQSRSPRRKSPIRIIPLGGLGEVGKNITAYECKNDIFIVDTGLAFPNEEMLGVDIVIPDFSYLEKRADNIRGIVITHGHEDHIGGLAYLLKKVNVPVYATKLTIGLIEGKLKEHGLLDAAKLNVVKPRDQVKMGSMTVEFIRVNHSIPDACAMAIHTPAGIIIQTGDFKIDYTPVSGNVTDLARFGELGSKGVLALLSDSTNAERPGSTLSERTVGESFERLFKHAWDKRIIVATFASNVDRIQQVVNMAEQTERKVVVTGRSMINVCAKALELGYLKAKQGTMIEMEAVSSYPPEKVVILTTGSQGEPLSALTRMSTNDHRQISITSNDCIIISASPIPGNEKFVGRIVNDLMKLGANVIYEKMHNVHVSGHACQDELKLILALTRPKFFMPVHGEYKHLMKHAGLAMNMGVPEANITIAQNGDVIETNGLSFKIVDKVPAGSVLVDGLGVGDVGSVVLRDRKHLAQDGLMIVVTTIERASGKIISGPDIVSRGFVYVRESEELIYGAKKAVKVVLQNCIENNIREWGIIKTKMREELSSFVYQRTKRSPMILPIIMEI